MKWFVSVQHTYTWEIDVQADSKDEAEGNGSFRAKRDAAGFCFATWNATASPQTDHLASADTPAHDVLVNRAAAEADLANTVKWRVRVDRIYTWVLALEADSKEEAEGNGIARVKLSTAGLVPRVGRQPRPLNRTI